MIETAREARSCSAYKVIQDMFAGAEEFTQAAPQPDDMTLLVIESGGFLPSIKKAGERVITSEQKTNVV